MLIDNPDKISGSALHIGEAQSRGSQTSVLSQGTQLTREPQFKQLLRLREGSSRQLSDPAQPRPHRVPVNPQLLRGRFDVCSVIEERGKRLHELGSMLLVVGVKRRKHGVCETAPL